MKPRCFSYLFRDVGVRQVERDNDETVTRALNKEEIIFNKQKIQDT